MTSSGYHTCTPANKFHSTVGRETLLFCKIECYIIPQNNDCSFRSYFSRASPWKTIFKWNKYSYFQNIYAIFFMLKNIRIIKKSQALLVFQLKKKAKTSWMYDLLCYVLSFLSKIWIIYSWIAILIYKEIKKYSILYISSYNIKA